MRQLARGQTMVLATHNTGKLREFTELLQPYGVKVVSAGELGLPEPEETETSFLGNARLKAMAAATASGMPSLADDSGFSVAALGGDPGIYSARWARSAIIPIVVPGLPVRCVWRGRMAKPRAMSPACSAMSSGRLVGRRDSATTRCSSRAVRR